MKREEFEIFKAKLKEFQFKYDDSILFNILEKYDVKIIDKIFEDLIKNTPKLNGINITFELNETLKNQPQIKAKQLLISDECYICGSTGFIYMLDENNYSVMLVCNCSIGKRKGKYNLNMPIWNGELKQIVNGEKLVLMDCYKWKLEEEDKS